MQPTTPLTPEEWEALRARRRAEYPKNEPDFSHNAGHCWSCKFDFIEHYRDRYPTEMITGCPGCHRSFCD